MDIKWKNRSLLILLMVLLTLGLSGLLPILNYGSTFLKKDYFQTVEFEYELTNFIDNLSYFELDPNTKEESIKNITVTDDEIYLTRDGKLNDQIENIKAEYDWQIDNAQKNQGPEEANRLIEEKAKKVEEIKKKFDNVDHTREEIFKKKQQSIENYFNEVESRRGDFLSYKSAISYYLKDSETGEVFTNIPEASRGGIKKSDQVVFFQEYPSAKYPMIKRQSQTIYNDNHSWTVMIKEGKTFEGQIAVMKTDSPNFLLEKYQNFKELQRLFIIFSIISMASFVLFTYFFRKTKDIQSSFLKKWKPIYVRIPLDIRMFVLFISVIITLSMLAENNSAYVYRASILEIYRIFWFIWIALLIGFIYIQVRYLLEMKSIFKEEWKGSLLYKMYMALKDAFLNRRVGTQLLVLVVVIFGVGFGFPLAFFEEEFAFVYILFICFIGIPVGIFVVKKMGYLNRILLFGKGLEKGDFQQELPISGKTFLADHARVLNEVKNRLNTSKYEQAKSERLKVELISNVSHDLRTPLTSIITYAELLRTQDLDEEDRMSYIQIIDRKSKRLKVLIDDLFEVSKMASGNMELKIEKVDICQLLQQALAEYSETIEQSTLEFRVTKLDNPIFVNVDGQKIWRVFENLIGNILKYSLNHTRVYISIEALEERVVLTFKNISKYELGANTDEMLERFKRGDTSRHTEGSGLGLAIAKSIIDLHGGNLEVEADGDLFKVNITL